MSTSRLARTDIFRSKAIHISNNVKSKRSAFTKTDCNAHFSKSHECSTLIGSSRMSTYISKWLRISRFSFFAAISTVWRIALTHWIYSFARVAAIEPSILMYLFAVQHRSVFWLEQEKGREINLIADKNIQWMKNTHMLQELLFFVSDLNDTEHDVINLCIYAMAYAEP